MEEGSITPDEHLHPEDDRLQRRAADEDESAASATHAA